MLAGSAPPKGGEGGGADGWASVGLAEVETKADHFDIGADLNRRLGILMDGAPFEGFTGRVHAPALMYDTGAADWAEGVVICLGVPCLTKMGTRI